MPKAPRHTTAAAGAVHLAAHARAEPDTGAVAPAPARPDAVHEPLVPVHRRHHGRLPRTRTLSCQLLRPACLLPGISRLVSESGPCPSRPSDTFLVLPFLVDLSHAPLSPLAPLPLSPFAPLPLSPLAPLPRCLLALCPFAPPIAFHYPSAPILGPVPGRLRPGPRLRGGQRNSASSYSRSRLLTKEQTLPFGFLCAAPL